MGKVNVKDLGEERKMREHLIIIFAMDKALIFLSLFISINIGIAIH